MTGTSGLAQLQLQNGLDAGATAGAAVMADGINAVAALNGALLALGIPAMMGHGGAAAAARKIQALQDQTVKWTPKLAQGEASAAAMTTGAAVALLSSRQGEKWPSLMVKRTYLLPGLFGHRFPLWMSDDLRRRGDRPWGDRVIYLDGWVLAGRGVVRVPLKGSAGAAASCGGGGASSLPLLLPRYYSRLIPSRDKPAAGS